MQKSVNLPYKSGYCRSCEHCSKMVTCDAHIKNGHPLPCPAIHACKKYREKAGAGAVEKILDKIANSRLLSKEQKRSLSKTTERTFHGFRKKKRKQTENKP